MTRIAPVSYTHLDVYKRQILYYTGVNYKIGETHEGTATMDWMEPVSYTHLDVYKRQGITRSSVAVHISNLMKKGCIAGKGYIVTRSPYVTVVGGMNMDIGGWPSEELVAQDSNPGRVRMSPGGVGRNIAHNMSLMGLDVRLLTAFGDDVYAQKLAAVCGELGIDCLLYTSPAPKFYPKSLPVGCNGVSSLCP